MSSRINTTSPRRTLVIATALSATASALIVYPAVHEGGHYLAARLTGVEVRGVVWTMLTGKAPHVSLGPTSGDVLPWVNAGGLILPTIVGIAILVIWLIFADRWPAWARSAFAIPGIGLLAGNAGTVVELFREPTLLHHMQPLARHLGLSGIASFGFQSLPAIVSLIFTGLWFRRLWMARRKAPGSAPQR